MVLSHYFGLHQRKSDISMRSTANLLIATFHSPFLQLRIICEMTKNIGAGYKKNALPGAGKTPHLCVALFLEFYALCLIFYWQSS
ncbi:TPA: hypothetical protein ACQ49S_002119 [Klebsiella aerogenes]